MCGPLEDGIKRWTAKRKSALVIEIIQGKTMVAEANRSFDPTPSEIENRVDDARKGMENALKANPLDVLKWSQRTGQSVKVYPEPFKGNENGEAPELYRSV